MVFYFQGNEGARGEPGRSVREILLLILIHFIVQCYSSHNFLSTYSVVSSLLYLTPAGTRVTRKERRPGKIKDCSAITAEFTGLLTFFFAVPQFRGS